jgi:hypothetical protein
MNWSDEETHEPLIADGRNFYKVEKWSRDGQRVTELLFAGSSLDKAKRIFDRWAKHRPRDHPAAEAGVRGVAAETKSPGQWKAGLSSCHRPDSPIQAKRSLGVN